MAVVELVDDIQRAHRPWSASPAALGSQPSEVERRPVACVALAARENPRVTGQKVEQETRPRSHVPEDEKGPRSIGSEGLAEGEESETRLFRDVFGADRGPLCRSGHS